MSNIFAFYLDIVDDCDFDGIVINHRIDDFFLDKKILNLIHYELEVDRDEDLDDRQLKELSLNIFNDKLVEFILLYVLMVKAQLVLFLLVVLEISLPSLLKLGKSCIKNYIYN